MTACNQLSNCPNCMGIVIKSSVLDLSQRRTRVRLIKIVADISIAFSRVSADLLGGT
jgi:hypothetical protein